jgi:hypothetical protein
MTIKDWNIFGYACLLFGITFDYFDCAVVGLPLLCVALVCFVLGLLNYFGNKDDGGGPLRPA